MNEKLEKLISFAITDGVVTEKEREILLRKAQEEGADLDEFEMILDAKLHEKQEELKEKIKAEITQSPIIEKPNSNKEGDLKKCPSCGSPVVSFNTKCGECGHEFRNIESSSSILKLFNSINELENNKKEDETNVGKAIGRMFGEALSGTLGGKAEGQKRELIINFPVPNSKEDILEFLTLAVPRAKKTGGFLSIYSSAGQAHIEHNKMVPIWKTKCEQIIMKARFSMQDDKSTLAEIEYYAKELGIK